MRLIFCDIETERLVNPEKIWVCVTKEKYQKPKVWKNLHIKENQDEFIRYLGSDNVVFVGHNFLGFDLPVLERILQKRLTNTSTLDTLVCSRLFNSYTYRTHSLEDWGERLGYHKIKFSDFSHLSDEMITYCIRDVEITERLYFLFEKYINDPAWKDAIDLEHFTADVLGKARTEGFGFDIEGLEQLYRDIDVRVSTLYDALQRDFPPTATAIRTIQPVLTQKGKLNSKDFRWLEGDPELLGYDIWPFTRIDFERFNPASTKQCIDRLWAAGWKPFEKTKGHIKAERDGSVSDEQLRYGWTISEDNLSTLPDDAPESFKNLVLYITLFRRLTTLREWRDSYNGDTKSIHGTINHIGTWTHRCSHVAPNQGNIPRATSLYGADMRSLWRARGGKVLVGVDAEGIQLRVLAHYMEDEGFTKALVSGEKEKGTDVHSLNRSKLGTHICKSRDAAKTFIYSWVLGASAPKTAKVLECSVGEAVVARQNFLDGYPGLKKVREEIIPADVKRSYFIGFDGRKVICDSAHKMLAGYLQNGEVVIMKWAMRLWYNKLTKEGVPFKLVDFVHDEWQTETEARYAEYVKATQIWAIERAGYELGIKCPLAGSGSIGLNWRDTH